MRLIIALVAGQVFAAQSFAQMDSTASARVVWTPESQLTAFTRLVGKTRDQVQSSIFGHPVSRKITDRVSEDWLYATNRGMALIRFNNNVVVGYTLDAFPDAFPLAGQIGLGNFIVLGAAESPVASGSDY